MGDLKAYRHTHTGATRMSKSELGWPYVPADRAGAGGLADMTVADLKELATAKGIDTAGMKKADLVEALEAA